MKLGKYFDTKYDRLLITINNPTDEQINNLKFTIKNLDKVRENYGPIFVTSGLRPPKDKYSQHEDGYAVDFVAPKVNIHLVFEWIINNLVFDQVILEHDLKSNQYWIHYSVKEFNNRKEAYTAIVKIVNNKTISKYTRCN